MIKDLFHFILYLQSYGRVYKFLSNLISVRRLGFQMIKQSLDNIIIEKSSFVKHNKNYGDFFK